MNGKGSISSVKLKQGVFIFFLLLMCLPMLQQRFNLIKERPLDGVDKHHDLPIPASSTWFSGQYQKTLDSVLTINAGLRPTLVRIHNQLNYCLFNIAKAEDVIAGKNDHIFLRPYVNAYTGADFIGMGTIEIQAEKIKLVQQELKKKNIDFFIVLAPGKGSFYPEHIPDRLKTGMNSDSTNYSCYKKALLAGNINVLDLREHFLSIKGAEKYPLFSNTGVHWTEYGCYVAGSEMVSYIEKLRRINLPDIKIKSLKTLAINGSDYDAASLMNVFSSIPHPEVAIPSLEFRSDSSTQKPRFLCIADSYFPGIINTDIPSNVFTDYHFWLYNYGIYPEGYLKPKIRVKTTLKRDIERQDVICILATDATLPQFPFGFIDETYELYAKKDAAYYTLKQKEFKVYVLKTLDNINNNKKWRAQLIENAKRKGIPEIDEFINNAVWLYTQTQAKNKIAF